MFAANRSWFRLLCWLMAVITPLAPSASVWAQSPAVQAENGTQYVLPYSAAMVSARPRQLLTSETAQMLPVEVAQAACLKELGFDPLQVNRVVFSMIPPLAGPPSYSIAVEFTERIDLTKLSPKLIQHTVPGERDGQSYLQSQNPQMPSLYWADKTTLLIAPEHSLNQLLSNKSAKPDSFAQQLVACENDDLALLVNLAVVRPFIMMGINQVRGEVPDEFQDLLEIPSLLKQVRARVNLSGNGPMELSCAADDNDAADRVETLITELIDVYQQQALAEAAKMLQSEDPVEQAMGRYINRTTETWTKQLVPARTGERFTIFETPVGEDAWGGPASLAVIGVLVGLLLPAVQAAREAARRNVSTNNMKQLLLAVLNYEAATGRLPAHANYDEDGKPLLSWRVHMLPYLETGEGRLYDQFRLDEPWDSEHNKKLIPLMPQVFIDPSSKLTPELGRTHYLGVLGEEFGFNGTDEGRRFVQFTDGTSNSILLVQCNDQQAEVWTKPADWEHDKSKPFAGLVPNLHLGIFLAGFVDGHVSAITQDVDPEVFQALLTISGGEVVPDH